MKINSILLKQTELVTILWIIYSLFVSSCNKKEESITPNLACKVISFNNNYSGTLQITYTADNKIEKYSLMVPPNWTATAEYGANGKLAKLKYQNINSYITQHDYQYNNNGLLSKINYLDTDYSDNILMEQRTFEYNSNQQVPHKINYFTGNLSSANQIQLSGYRTLEYNAEGNIRKTIYYNSDGTSGTYSEFEYDSNPNPFKPFVYLFAYDPTKLLEGQLNEIMAFSKNNIVKHTVKNNSSGTIISSISYVYEYNSKGYPIKADINLPSGNKVVYLLEYECN